MPTMPHALKATIAALLLAGCADRVTVPAADATGPDVTLLVLGAGESFSVGPASGPRALELERHRVLTFWASARDPEGVRRVSIAGEVSSACRDGDVTQATTATILVRMPASPDAGASPGGSTVDGRLAAFVLDVPAEVAGCPGGRAFGGLDGRLAATGENAHGARATTATVAFRAS